MKLNLFWVGDKEMLRGFSPKLVERGIKNRFKHLRSHGHSYEWLNCHAGALQNQIMDYTYLLRQELFNGIGDTLRKRLIVGGMYEETRLSRLNIDEKYN